MVRRNDYQSLNSYKPLVKLNVYSPACENNLYKRIIYNAFLHGSIILVREKVFITKRKPLVHRLTLILTFTLISVSLLNVFHDRVLNFP